MEMGISKREWGKCEPETCSFTPRHRMLCCGCHSARRHLANFTEFAAKKCYYHL